MVIRLLVNHFSKPALHAVCSIVAYGIAENVLRGEGCSDSSILWPHGCLIGPETWEKKLQANGKTVEGEAEGDSHEDILGGL